MGQRQQMQTEKLSFATSYVLRAWLDPDGGGGSVCALPSVVMENSSPSPPSSEMQHSTVGQASASLFLLSCESLLALLPTQSPPHSWLDHKEGWALKNWCFQTVVLEKTFESPLDSKEIKPVNPKGNQPWIFIGRTDAEVEASILWPPGVKSQLFGRDLMLGKIEGRRRRGWQRMRWLDGITNSVDTEFEQTPEDGEEQGNLACCSPWGHKESDMTEQLNNHHLNSLCT